MAVSAFDHPLLAALVGDDALARLFAVEAELAAMLRFEAALAEAQAAEGLIPAPAAQAIGAASDGFRPDTAALAAATGRDGVAVPGLLAQLRTALGAPHARHLHFGATSQDAVDTGLALRLGEALAILDRRLAAAVAALEALEARDGARPAMAHTRMQAAVPVTAARKIRAWSDPLMRHRTRLRRIADAVAVLHFGGAAGTLDALGEAGPAVAARLARRLGLNLAARPRHGERDGQAELAGWLSLVTGSLGKMGQDVALLAQSEVAEIRLAAGGGSSAMPHKVNPVRAETLVALARFNATLLAGMHQALVHEGERSGAAWTLEWMLLPQMVVATGAALTHAAALAGEIAFSGEPPQP
ncbi:3-carboxy-cis,cis-muconate cycloisomerase [Aquibium sp. A9E412]|uniref:3-carboxy-cis,cis-muconate cycloisomerase n=1 Tax=Aquibium sp. A9E412 TaxID=2976767 RepID=UPI0025B1347A|nr:3-carboxy-cis,cis-muconate cycloisomerase [Aquibium sp. A9E412]MDN2566562.1 3-carboxy-cis,cis-muconate cycloisomerase [Aquibium sp. A9E412]